MVAIALDTVRSGSPDPDVIRGAALALVVDESLELSLVGPSDAVQAALEETELGLPVPRARVTDAARAVSADDDAVVAVRARSDASIRVAVDLLAGGEVDAVVTRGPLAAAVAAARFGLGRMPGMREPVLAVEVALPTGRLLVADAGASVRSTTAALARTAELAAVLAVKRGNPSPRLALHAPTGVASGPLAEADALIQAADLGRATYLGARSTSEVLSGEVDVLVTTAALGETLVSTVRALVPDAGGHLGVLLGTTAPVATLDASDPDTVASAIAELATQLRGATGVPA